MIRSVLFLAMSALFFQAFAHADSSSTVDQVCLDTAKSEVAKVAKISPEVLSFYGGSLIGDGVDVLEMDSFQVKGKQGFYVIGLDQDDCSIFYPVKLMQN